mmetsp:Transcript_117143/g.373092  ORF Transcript_117143/g.373092 Transcript_117143/m.373092 type:complete len:138 (+) Transcript_117143:84-497(+)
MLGCSKIMSGCRKRQVIRRLGLKVRTSQIETDVPLRVQVPYDNRGARSQNERTHWNLNLGQKVRLNEHNDIENAGQSFKLDASTIGEVLRPDDAACSLVIGFEGTAATVRLGVWWLGAAQRGAVDRLPLVNVNPTPC